MLMSISLGYESRLVTLRLPRLPVRAAWAVMPPCGISLPSFARRVFFVEVLRQLTFSGLLRRVVCSAVLRQFFSLWLGLQPEMAIPAWAVSQCDGGRAAAAGCAQFLQPSVTHRRHAFEARPQGIPESF